MRKEIVRIQFAFLTFVNEDGSVTVCTSDEDAKTTYVYEYSTYMLVIDGEGKALSEITELPGIRLNMNDVLRYNRRNGKVYWAINQGGTSVTSKTREPKKLGAVSHRFIRQGRLYSREGALMSTAYENDFESETETSRYTYADYSAWETDKRYEIINGEAYMMSAPSVNHQIVSGELFGQFWNFLKGKPCQVFAAPFDVRLFPRDDESDDTVVQPDLLVICDASKIADGKACRGAPDMVIEILSPSNTEIPLLRKFTKFLKAGVREYWIIDPETKNIQVHILERGDDEPPEHYISRVYSNAEALAVSILPGLRIGFKSIWDAIAPKA
ncbi:MAG: Uma2 family endonuclease [Treponema sp.]|nr:Uma2 family endonuclease [Treponema sp.]